MDMFADRYCREIILCFGTQLGKTESEMNMIGYAIDESPAPALVVYPTDVLGRSISKNRLEPAVLSSASLAAKYRKTESETLELQFTGMYLAIVGANSPSQLASRPIKYLIVDEEGKFPLRAGKDSSPILLAKERQKTFLDSKTVRSSSPTLKDSGIWPAFMEAEVQKRYFVPCPHCGAYLTFELKDIKWPEALNAPDLKREREQLVVTESWYECPFCHERIYDQDKVPMLLRGEWRAVEHSFDSNGRDRWTERRDPPRRPKSVAYNLNSIYSPWERFGNVAAMFLASKDDPVEFMNFMNGWMALPWVPAAATMNSDAVMKLARNYERLLIPSEAQLVTCGVDVQLDHFWYVIRAWGPRVKSWLVDYGRLEHWEDVQDLLDREIPIEGGGNGVISVMILDSGYRTEEVYDFAASNVGLVFPSKGSSQARCMSPITESRVVPKGGGGPELKLLVVDTNYYKDMLSRRIHPTEDNPPRWFVFKDIHREYAEQVCSEHCVEDVDRKGRKVYTWQPVTDHTPNHLLDCEVIATVGAEYIGVRNLREEEEAV